MEAVTHIELEAHAPVRAGGALQHTNVLRDEGRRKRVRDRGDSVRVAVEHAAVNAWCLRVGQPVLTI